ncbi:MAG TPA: ABC transporter ATP-binding protein [Acidimicrobiales bacterium]|nr:ABC transporter ATP-binding protein [Acidimicrobiales bacterium]
MSTAENYARPILSAENIDFSYGSLQVLFGVSLDLQEGEALALLGTNGAGKSTLLNVIAGAVPPPTHGSVFFDGRETTREPAERLVGQGLVLVRGGRGVFADLTVRENLDVQLRTLLRRDKKEAAHRRGQVLETFPRLGERLSQKAGSLSGGEQQQLAIAKAVMLDPNVLCIDELSLGLAPVVVQELLGIVRAIHASGTSVILVEQSLNIACDLCSRAIFMEKGQVRFEGAPSELLESDDIARAVFLGASR